MAEYDSRKFLRLVNWYNGEEIIILLIIYIYIYIFFEIDYIILKNAISITFSQ